MKEIKNIIIGVLIGHIILIIGLYLYNKTLGKDKTDCMIYYIQNYYPYGSVYKIPGTNEPHIDQRGLDYLDNEYEVYGCIITDNFFSAIINIPYCYTTLTIETLLGNKNNYDN